MWQTTVLTVLYRNRMKEGAQEALAKIMYSG